MWTIFYLSAEFAKALFCPDFVLTCMQKLEKTQIFVCSDSLNEFFIIFLHNLQRNYGFPIGHFWAVGNVLYVSVKLTDAIQCLSNDRLDWISLHLLKYWIRLNEKSYNDPENISVDWLCSCWHFSILPEKYVLFGGFPPMRSTYHDHWARGG